MELCLKYYFEYVYRQIKMLLIEIIYKKFERERKVITAHAYPGWAIDIRPRSKSKIIQLFSGAEPFP
jgi:hypothetical protein